jgi:hypothetical protein
MQLFIALHRFSQRGNGRGNCSAVQMHKAPRQLGYVFDIVMYFCGCGGALPP